MSKLKIVCLVLGSILWTTSISLAQSTTETETIIIETYYPAPYGAYDELSSNTLILNPQIDKGTPCSQEGAMYYNSSDKKIYLCNGSEWKVDTDSFWAASSTNSNNIYNTNSGNVGIGTNAPVEAKLVIKGSGASGETFGYSGSVQYYTVPYGVVELTVLASGASGSDGEGGGWIKGGGGGGRGALVQAIVPVTPGEILSIYVGATNGNNGYSVRSGGLGWSSGGNGGGASEVWRGATRLIVAGGGGGGGGGGACTTGGSGGDGVNNNGGGNGGSGGNGCDSAGLSGESNGTGVGVGGIGGSSSCDYNGKNCGTSGANGDSFSGGSGGKGGGGGDGGGGGGGGGMAAGAAAVVVPVVPGAAAGVAAVVEAWLRGGIFLFPPLLLQEMAV